MWKNAWYGGLVVAVSLMLSGCDDDSCGELAEVCARCPDSGSGVVAQAACEDTVDKGDAEACAEQVDLGTYLAFGCDP